MAEELRLWGAWYRAAPAPSLTAISRAEPSYFKLLPYDVAGSLAHARELNRAGILDDEELATLSRALAAIAADYAAGRVAPTPGDEDVHTFVERLLLERLGPLGGKLRAGRSRNDQAANDLRLFLRAEARALLLALLPLQEALLAQAEQHAETLAPGFTHLQPAQPIAFGHQLLAHAQALLRDGARLADWDRRAARSPLGAAALAGSAIALHPELSAQELGYDAPCDNSIDAVAARDHVAEFLFITAMLGIDLSRLAEEICLWASRQFAWVRLDDAFATGSSIMPQKKNPDIAELTRGRAGRLIGNLTGLLATLKSLPLAYNRDLFEDKHIVFDSLDGLLLMLPAMAGLVASLRVDVAAQRRQAGMGYTLATEVADWLARRGVPFNEAHEIAGKLVGYCLEKGIELDAASDADLAAVDPRLTPELRSVLSLEAAVAARSAHGGTAPARVREQAASLRSALEAQRRWAEEYRGPRA